MKKMLLIPVSVLSLTGCASLYTQSHDAYDEAGVGCTDSKTIPNVYSGTVFDLYCLPAENVAFFCLVDLPMSLAVDTLVLPYSIYRQASYGSWYNQKVCEQRKQPQTAQPSM